MTSTHFTRRRILAFGIGMLLMLLALVLVGRVESRGPACSQGLGRPMYPTYAGARYGWPLTAVQIGHTSCQGSPDTWTPQLFVA